MSWTTTADLRAQVCKLWDRGQLLAALATGQPAFPLRLQLKTPDSSEITERFDDVRQWAAGLRAVPRLRMETRSFTHRVFGANVLPHEAWLDSLDDAVVIAGKQREAVQYRQMLDLAQVRLPALRPWLTRKPLRALSAAAEWPLLIAVVEWLLAHPRPEIYVRQVDIPGVHSKFIESNRAVLAELFDLALPAAAIDAAFTGAAQFNRRYGFRDKPSRLRFRLLDPELSLIPGLGSADMTLDAASFAALPAPVRNVFITENEVNYLAFPPVPDSMLIFGAGYGWEMLSRAEWLKHVRIIYWGDIDTHGFAILNQLRAKWPHVESLLMDKETLLAHRHAWAREGAPTSDRLPILTAEEQVLYGDLCAGLPQERLRLEQEKVGFGWLTSALEKLALT